MNKKTNQSGVVIIYELVIIFIFSTLMVSVISYSVYELKAIRSTVNREQAFQIAEAGNNYYQWHLVHFPVDYKDGTNSPGPYVHDYLDKDTNQVIGRYSLTITPPPAGSTIVTIQSTAYTLTNPSVKRTVTTKYGIPSLAKYAFLTNSDVWIGPTESVSGALHSNGGIRFDGIGNAPITSAKQTYTCQAWSGSPPCPAIENGVWGAAAVATKNFFQFPLPSVDFSTITSDLATIKSGAQAGGIYLPPSNAQGYSLVFNATGTVSVYKVTSLRAHATGYDVNNAAHNEDLDYNARTLQFTQAIPTNGLIYVEDRTWVEGTVAGRAMVAAASLPYNAPTAPSILIPNNLVYSAKDGSSELGLIAQQDVLVTFFAPTNLEVDAAMIAQNGSTQRYYFAGDMKNSITIYGSISSYGTWTWSWVNGAGGLLSGYLTTNTVYDSNLLYGPPPSFPLSVNGYQQISWDSD
ncbi:MAG: pilus assembly PilX N-terminal domain-containing protein [Candidatus Doudnabacteria bacterium]